MEPRLIRPAPEPLGNYFRPGYQDYAVLEQMLVDGSRVGSGLVFRPVHSFRAGHLVVEANRRELDTVLDTMSLELASEGGFARAGVPQLPWAASRPHTAELLAGHAGRQMVVGIVNEIEDRNYSSVLAPSHLIEGSADPWLQVDTDLVWRLRGELDTRGLNHVSIYYPLMIRSSTIGRDLESVMMAKSHLRSLPIDAVWLRVHPFGTASSGPIALRRYIELCREMHDLGIPLVAEHSGTLGVALMAVGAVGGIESGITTLETVNLDSILKVQRTTGRGFSPSPRVYLQTIGAFLDARSLESFFEQKGTKHVYACLDPSCCRAGWQDMRRKPREHFLQKRSSEVSELSKAPASLRPGLYMEEFLRPASDYAVRAAEIDPSLLAARKRLDSWRRTLRAVIESQSDFTVGLPASGKRLRRSA